MSDSQPLSDQGKPRQWFVYSEEDDGQVVSATTAAEAVARWAASEWTDIEDGLTIHAHDIALIQKFTARQTNEIADDDMDTLPKFEFSPAIDEGER